MKQVHVQTETESFFVSCHPDKSAAVCEIALDSGSSHQRWEKEPEDSGDKHVFIFKDSL